MVGNSYVVPQNQKISDSEAVVEGYISLFAQWQKFYKEIIRVGTIIKNTGLLKALTY